MDNVAMSADAGGWARSMMAISSRLAGQCPLLILTVRPTSNARRHHHHERATTITH